MFEKDWMALLKDAGVSSFHATQFFAKRDYRGLNDDLADVIHHHRLYPIGAGVDVNAFNDLTTGERRFVTGARMRGSKPITSGAQSQPYYLAFQYLVIEATNQAREDSIINFTFDRQNVLQAKALETYHDYVNHMSDESRRRKLGRISFDDSAKYPGLQAADMHTHLWYSYMSQRTGMTEARHSAMKKLTSKRGAMRLFDAERLEELLSGLSPEDRARIRAAS